MAQFHVCVMYVRIYISISRVYYVTPIIRFLVLIFVKTAILDPPLTPGTYDASRLYDEMVTALMHVGAARLYASGSDF